MRPYFYLMRHTLAIVHEDTLQMFVRLGYGPTIKAGPRWPFETRISSA